MNLDMFNVCSLVTKFIPMKMHAYVSAHKGNIFLSQMQMTEDMSFVFFAGNFFGEVSEYVCSVGMQGSLR